ncbi:hypothetical protein ACIBCH_09960 [Amycolatopsis thailandensis]|uniref:hypothetical protein n=1 Tax=Amycolatopsis thailandensis TaxID=589330 RepID=UPI0037A59D63
MDTTGVLRGVDVSHHQEGLDVSRLPVDYVIARTAQAAGGKYGTTKDRAYSKHKANALRGGKLFSSYLYLGSSLSAVANAALHASIEPDRKIPVMVDWEDGSGDGAFLNACITELRKSGYQVWSTYAPKWYWQKMGSPNLTGLPPLVSSRYPDNNPGGYAAQYGKCPESYWNGYGGNTVAVLQFSSSGRLDPYPGTNLDLLAYRGTRAQLAALLSQNAGGGGGTPAPAPTDQGVDLMERRTIPASKATTSVRLLLSGSPGAAIIVRPRINSDGITEKPVWQGNIYAWGSDKQGVGGNPLGTPGFNPKTVSHRRYALAGAVWADFEYSSDAEFEIDIVG